MLQTTITRLLGIAYPIVQGGMAWVADASLASAVSAGGGLGLIGAGSAPAEWVRRQIAAVRTVTDKPFGVNIMLMSPHAADIAAVVAEQRVPVVTTGAGNPGPFIAAWKEAGVKVIPVVPSVALALRMQRAGADALVCEGCEAGGHIGELTTMTLVPQVASAVSVPVIAAGGIADGRGLAAVLMLGAAGAQVGTRFICAQECSASQAFKDAVLKANDLSTGVTGRSIGLPVRAIKNPMTRKLLELEAQGLSKHDIEATASGGLRAAVIDGDWENGSFMAGQSAGLVGAIEPAADILRDICEGAEILLKTVAAGVTR